MRRFNLAEQFIGAARQLSDGLWSAHTAIIIAWLYRRPLESPSRLCWINLSLPSGAKRKFYLTDYSQVKALLEVFVQDDYAVDMPAAATVVVDLGANAGQAAVYFRDRFPSARILSVEADPRTALVTERNLRDDSLTTLNKAAIADEDGVVALGRASGYSWASNVIQGEPKIGLPQADQVQVRGVKLSTLLQEEGIDKVDVLKVDIEGAELTALTCDGVLLDVRFVVGELHPSVLRVDSAVALEAFRERGAFEHAAVSSSDIFTLAR